MSRKESQKLMPPVLLLAVILSVPILLALPGLAGAAEQLHLFTRGTGDIPLWKYADGGSWKGPFSLDGQRINASPAAESHNGLVHLFARGIDNRLLWRTWNGTWSSWGYLGESLTAAPAVVSHNGKLYLFAVGGDKGLYVRMWNGSQWTGWDTVAQPNFVNGQPAAVSYGSLLIVYVRGMDGALWQRVWDGTKWGAWGSLGGALSFGPAAVTYKGILHLFGVGTDGGLYWRYWNGSALSAWVKIGEATETPAATVYANSTLYVFARGRDGFLYQKDYNGAQWSAWGSHSLVTVSGPGATDHFTTVAANRPPTLARVDATRVTHSLGREESVRSEGVANRPGLAPLLALTAPQAITLDPSRTGKPDPNSPIVRAAAAIPSCCTLLVAEGAADPDGNSLVYRWNVPSKGTFYSTGAAGSAFPAGAKITDLGQYNRNSIIWEAPAIGFPVQDESRMWGNTNIGVYVYDSPTSASVPLASASQFRALEWDLGVRLQLSFLSSRPLPANPPAPYTSFPNGTLMIFFADLSNTFAIATDVTFRVDCGSRKRVAGQSVFEQSITATGGRIRCPYEQGENGAQVTVTAVASTPGTASGGNPFIFPLQPSLPATMDLFRSRGCTAGDTITELVRVTESTTLTIDVWDSGPSLDDAFDLLVDGMSLGRTHPGQNQIFNVGHLNVGEHELCVVYVYCQPGLCRGGGTYTVALSGVTQRGPMTFTDGSRAQATSPTGLPPELGPFNGAQPTSPYQRACFTFRIP